MNKYEKNYAVNLKRLRRKANMTQKELADATGYSEKTVSKWECAAGIPDVLTLFAIAGKLHTNIEELFRDDDEVFFLGIDGGGTKTELALADTAGNILRSLRADCCNPMDIGIDAAKKILSDAVYQICDGVLFSSIVAFAGIAGGTSANMRPALTDFFRDFKFRAFDNNSDNNNIITAGLGKRDGITLILGTGICAFSQINGVRKRVAGWGYLIDEGGSAYNIGRDALSAYYAAFDGAGPETILTREIDRFCPEGGQILLGRIYEGRKKTIASFAPLVFTAASEGDGVAKNILLRNLSIAAGIISTAAKPFETALPLNKIPVILAGGLTEQPTMLEYLIKALGNAERYDIKILECASVNGAVSLARELWDNINK